MYKGTKETLTTKKKKKKVRNRYIIVQILYNHYSGYLPKCVLKFFIFLTEGAF